MIRSVTLREKKITKGRLSLYLDIYPPIIKKGKESRREFLKIYIFEKTKNQLQKNNNKQNLNLAEQIRQKRDNEINKPEIYTEFEKDQLLTQKKGELNFIDYYKSIADKRNGSTYQNWEASFPYLIDFFGKEATIKMLSIESCEEYKVHLLKAFSKRIPSKTLARNTAASYYTNFKTTLKEAYRNDVLTYDLNKKLTSIKEEETTKEFLTLDEVNRLVATEFKDDILKRACLFAILTGLRYVDIDKLVWGEIVFNADEKQHFIRFTQQKTKKAELMPISQQAYTLLGQPKGLKEKVFEGKLKYSSRISHKIQEWVDAAEINKKITFHCFRHTYAVLQLSNGTGIYTVMKMLGHTNINTTLGYAKLVDETKIEATHKITLTL